MERGGKDRRTMLPVRIGQNFQSHLEDVQRLHRQDLAGGYGRGRLPHALVRKDPQAPVEWAGSGCFRNTTAGTMLKQESRVATTSIPL
jgi:hypothetical protein